MDSTWHPVNKRTTSFRNRQVKDFVGYSPLTLEIKKDLKNWLYSNPDFINRRNNDLEQLIRQWCVDRKLEAPTYTEITRLTEAVQFKYGDGVFYKVDKMLGKASSLQLISSIASTGQSLTSLPSVKI